MGNEFSDTQEQLTEAATQGQSPEGDVQTQTQEQQGTGVQDRINDLTRKYRDEERARKAAEAQNAELLRALTEKVAQLSQPREQEPEIDPDERKKFEHMLNPLQRQIAQLTGAFAASTAQQEITSFAGSKTPPEVVAEAARVLAGWRSQGGRGNPKDALAFAMGNYILGKGQEESDVAAQRQSFNGAARSVQTGQGGGAVRKAPGSKRLSDDEVERLSPDDQATYWAAQVGDTEF